jgi:hypothetical protein
LSGIPGFSFQFGRTSIHLPLRPHFPHFTLDRNHGTSEHRFIFNRTNVNRMKKSDELQEFRCELCAHELSLSSASNSASTFLRRRKMAKKTKAKPMKK